MLIKDIEKMEAYTPTEYVNDSEPDLDADNLNKTERQLRDTVAKANEIIDTLKSLISNVSVNSEDTVPSSAVAYKMEQDIEQLNSNIFGERLSVESASTSVSDIQQWIISNIKSGLKYLNVFNDKSTVFAGEQGNFNIIVFGQNSNEATMIIINHWNAHIWAVSCGTDIGTWKWMQLYK